MSITGKFEYVDGTNFEGYLKDSGVSAEMIEIGKALKPTLEFTEKGDAIHMALKTEVANKDIDIKLGEEITDKTPDGRVVKATFTRNGNHLIQKQSFDNGFSATLDHEFTPTGIVLTYTWATGKATRNYKRV